MDIYHVHPDTGEYLISGQADPSPLEPGQFLIPAYVMVTPPPPVSDHEAAVAVGGTWQVVPDYRGTVWDKQSGESTPWSDLGELPAHLTSIPRPDRYSTWQGDAWAHDINLLREDKAADLKSACAAAIVAGKQCNALGSDHLYPTTKDDQSFLTARYSKAVALGEAGAPYKFMCADGDGVWDRRDHTAAQIIAVALAVEGHVTDMLNKLDDLMMQLSAATDEETIVGISW